MRIAHYLKRVRLKDGGVVRAVLDLCTVLAGAGHDVTLITYDGSDVPEEWRQARSDCPSLVQLAPPRVAGRLSRRTLRRASEVIGGHQVLHLHTIWTPSNGQMGRIARRVGTPYLVTIHGMLDEWCMSQRRVKKRVFLGLSGRPTLDNAAAVHCTAQGELDQARRWFANPNAVVIPLVFDLEPFRTLPGRSLAASRFPALRGNRESLLFLSRLHYKKGIEHLIRAAAVLRDRGVTPEVLIAGSGDAAYLESLRRLVTESRLDDRVHFLGMVTGPEKASLFEASDLFVLPTSQENFGFVLTESLACGTPVVTTRGVDIHPELRASGGACITEQDAVAIADVVQNLLSDPRRMAEMGRLGREWVFRELDSERIAARYVALYEQIASPAQRSEGQEVG